MSYSLDLMGHRSRLPSASANACARMSDFLLALTVRGLGLHLPRICHTNLLRDIEQSGLYLQTEQITRSEIFKPSGMVTSAGEKVPLAARSFTNGLADKMS